MKVPLLLKHPLDVALVTFYLVKGIPGKLKRVRPRQHLN